eukprot:6487276-Amphidinium_carterae.4
MPTRWRYGFGGRGRQSLTCESVLKACAVAVSEELATTAPEPSVHGREQNWGDVAARRLDGAEVGAGVVEEITGNNLVNADGENWLLLEAIGQRRQGEAVPAGMKVTKAGERGMVHFEEESSPLLIDAGGGLGALLRGSRQRQQLAASREPLEHHDLGVLTISTDVHGDRYKEWQEVASCMLEQRMDEWPLEGPRTMGWVIRFFARQGVTPTSWLERHLRDHAYSATDRSVYELRALAEIMEDAGCFDQLQLSNQVSFELVVRRWQLILEAHSSDPQAPSYASAEYFSGLEHQKFGVSPELTGHSARKMKDDAMVATQKEKPGVREGPAAPRNHRPPLQGDSAAYACGVAAPQRSFSQLSAKGAKANCKAKSSEQSCNSVDALNWLHTGREEHSPWTDGCPMHDELIRHVAEFDVEPICTQEVVDSLLRGRTSYEADAAPPSVAPYVASKVSLPGEKVGDADLRSLLPPEAGALTNC